MSTEAKPVNSAWVRGARRTAHGLVSEAAALFLANGPDDLQAYRKLAWAYRLGEFHGFSHEVESALMERMKGRFT